MRVSAQVSRAIVFKYAKQEIEVLKIDTIAHSLRPVMFVEKFMCFQALWWKLQGQS